MNRTTDGMMKAAGGGGNAGARSTCGTATRLGGDRARPEAGGGAVAGGTRAASGTDAPSTERDLHGLRVPDAVRACLATKPGEYDARRLRSQRDIIRDVMLSAADCETWLTLGELRALTRYGEASISAQLRHLRKAENGGYEVTKRQREGASPEHPGTDGRGDCVWEYRISRRVGAERSDIAAEELVTAEA